MSLVHSSDIYFFISFSTGNHIMAKLCKLNGKLTRQTHRQRILHWIRYNNFKFSVWLCYYNHIIPFKWSYSICFCKHWMPCAPYKPAQTLSPLSRQTDFHFSRALYEVCLLWLFCTPFFFCVLPFPDAVVDVVAWCLLCFKLCICVPKAGTVYDSPAFGFH